MSLITRWLIPLTLWAAGLFGCLQLHRLDLGHSICGPWGCGPPSSALLAMHSSWLILLLPLAWLAPRIWPRVNWAAFGWGLLWAGVAAILVIGVTDFFSFQSDPAQPKYVWQRFLFRLATLPDWPIVQLTLAAALLTQSRHLSPENGSK